MRIGLVSDTHVPISLKRLPSALLNRLDGVDAILHAGDFVSLGVLETLSEIAPTTAVAGNADPPEVARRLADRELLRFEGRTIGLKHGHQPHAVQAHYMGQSYDHPAFELFFQLMSAQLPEADVIVFGHFHRPLIRRWNDVLFISPGAIAPSRGDTSFAILESADTVNAQIIPLTMA